MSHPRVTPFANKGALLVNTKVLCCRCFKLTRPYALAVRVLRFRDCLQRPLTMFQRRLSFRCWMGHGCRGHRGSQPGWLCDHRHNEDPQADRSDGVGGLRALCGGLRMVSRPSRPRHGTYDICYVVLHYLE